MAPGQRPRSLALVGPVVVERLKQLGMVSCPEAEMTPEVHARLFASGLPRVAKLVDTTGVKAGEAK